MSALLSDIFRTRDEYDAPYVFLEHVWEVFPPRDESTTPQERCAFCHVNKLADAKEPTGCKARSLEEVGL